MKIVVIGDALVSSRTLIEAVQVMNLGEEEKEIIAYEWYSDLTKDEFQEHILDIERNGPDNVIIPKGILLDLKDADYLFCHYAPVSSEMIQVAPKLKMVGTCRGGLENVNIKILREKSIPLIHVIRNADPVADFTLGLMLAETRNIARAHCAIKNGKWEKSFSNDSYKTILTNQTVGVVGAGYIGKQLIKRLNGLNVPVLVFDPFVNQDNFRRLGLVASFVDSLEQLFKESDIVSLHMRVTPDTKHIINKDLLNLMKPSSYLINSARADLIVESDLLDILQRKGIAGAALDVNWTEPLMSDSPWLSLTNVTLTPHIAGDTIDAIPKSPFLLKDVVNEYLKTGYSDMIIK
ncbi:2-hydroxyacid dehydrogenase [Enterococcus camelliae]|uniref:2-hydroxyacid dehydrogenase n=1 Tax=Enterococcus camelliae TaxID=453959 RepID=A0ABW5TKS3_9ENTE